MKPFIRFNAPYWDCKSVENGRQRSGSGHSPLQAYEAWLSKGCTPQEWREWRMKYPMPIHMRDERIRLGMDIDYSRWKA